MTVQAHAATSTEPWYRLLWRVLTAAERRTMLTLTPAVILMALLETAGVASIVPFLALLANEHALEQHRLLAAVHAWVGAPPRETFFFAFGVAVLLLLTFSNVISALTTWGLLRFSWMGTHTLGTRVLEAYLRRPYEWFLTQNSADLGKNILVEVTNVVAGLFVQSMVLAARATAVAAVLLSLLLLDPLLAVGTGVLFGGIYGSIFVAMRKATERGGAERVAQNEARFKVVQEAFGGIKELKLYGNERTALESFATHSERFARLQARQNIQSALPRFALETIAFGGVLLIVLVLLRRGQALEQALPLLGLYAFAAYRILPGLQTVFTALHQIRFYTAPLQTLERGIAAAEAAPPLPSETEAPLAGAVELRGVSFRYQRAAQDVLAGMDLRVAPGEWVALVGPTGAGKSTLVDLLLGLLQPSAGELAVGGVPLADEGARRRWQRACAYVPQQIFLADDTVERNIAFGVAAGAIDHERVRWAARIAQLDDFVTRELPQGYQTFVGERGIRLSGGQRQRVGIARALYRRPALLVLDEATSALDNDTEARFFAALEAELRDTAVISIAHRLTTTRNFDRILVIEGGRVADSGTYAELQERHPHFRMVAGAPGTA